MKTLLVIFAASLLTGCTAIKEWVPSFNDSNQSAAIIDVRLSVARLNCAEPQALQVARIRDHIEWFELYSESKGQQQADVRRVIAPMKATVEDMYARVQVKDGSKTYCELKKTVMQAQAARAAEAVLGRF